MKTQNETNVCANMCVRESELQEVEYHHILSIHSNAFRKFKGQFPFMKVDDQLLLNRF